MYGKIVTAICLASMIATPSYAGNNKQSGSGPKHMIDGGPGAQANVRNTVRNKADGGAGGNGGNGGAGGAATATAGGSANARSGNISIGSLGGGSDRDGGGNTLYVPDGAGQAPCGGGLGLGIFGSASAGSGGGTLFEFGDCKRIREFAAIRAVANNTPGLSDADRARLNQGALAELCQIGRVLDAFGGACPTLYQTRLTVETSKYPFDYCETRHAGDVNQHLECDHVGKEH